MVKLYYALNDNFYYKRDVISKPILSSTLADKYNKRESSLIENTKGNKFYGFSIKNNRYSIIVKNRKFKVKLMGVKVRGINISPKLDIENI